MAIAKIILLTGRDEAPVLARILHQVNGSLAIDAAYDLEGLDRAVAPGARLLSFCSKIIVPAALLGRLETPAYNFHPGPPERPGRYPSVFALFDGNGDYGITVHEMAKEVDSGPIVMVERFALPAEADLAVLEELALTRLVQAFRRMAPYLAHVAAPLPHLPVKWSGRKTTRADYERLRVITPDMNASEIARRQRSCGV